jgi:hypothetical protein
MVLDAFRRDERSFRNGLRIGGFAWYSARHVEDALALKLVSAITSVRQSRM